MDCICHVDIECGIIIEEAQWTGVADDGFCHVYIVHMPKNVNGNRDYAIMGV